jgi:hypothetical protein
MNPLMRLKNITPLFLIGLVLGCIVLSVPVQAQPPSPTPAQQNPVALKLNEQYFVSAPQGWRVGNQTRDSLEMYVPLQKERAFAKPRKNEKPQFVVASEAGMLITVEHRRDHAEAVRRLSEIASEHREKITPTIIAGWPAIERRYRAPMPQPGEQDIKGGNIETTFVTTAVAAGSTVIRFDTMFAPDSDPKLVEQAFAIARQLRAPHGPSDVSKRELKELERKPTERSNAPQHKTPSQPQPGGQSEQRPGGGPTTGAAVTVQGGVGELEVASNDGQHVVVAANSGYSFSDNFGASYTFGGGTPCNQPACDGDPSLAVGKSNAIYYAWIGGASWSPLALSDGVSQSVDNGHTFTFRGLAAQCTGAPGCQLADQEHIAADRINAASGGGDRVYNVWRNFASTFSIRISCSSDSAATWTSGTVIGSGDFPRGTVGSDGFVYIAYASGSNMMLHKFSNCDAGLAAQAGFPVTVATFANVVCPVPGLDRCNNGNILSSPKVAVDDLDPTHIYYAFATSTAAGNEDVMVYDSTDGGATFTRSVRVNSAVAARRYMPWVSVYGGIAAVSWYDRRTATGANNDKTRYYFGGAAVRGPNLVALAETDLSGVDDAQCSTWPCAPRATSDSESCSAQPQLAGVCSVSGNPCDFSSSGCPAGETCVTGGGCPKYGDYNGNAVGSGRVYSAWSSAVPPVGSGGTAGSISVYASADRIPSDFYVRDWNDSPTSFDNGAQPSTHANFWSTSDVWNQSASTPAPPGPSGFVVGDPPSRSGSNFCFARVSRRAAAMSTAPSASVTVNFLLGDFGLGNAFTAIGSENVTFAAADMTQITPGHSWTVPAGASSHLCLAVQFVGPDGDTFAMPDITGTAPGPADPFIVNDNNKAQRNLQDTIGTGAGTELIAMIGNAERSTRAMRLRIKVPPGTEIEGVFEIIGGKQFKITNDSRIELGKLAPHEVRWVRFRAADLGRIEKPIPIDVFEDTSPPANGFTILLHRDSIENVAHRNLIDLAGVLFRLAKIEESEAAKKLADLSLRASKDPATASYRSFFAENRDSLNDVITKHLRLSATKDQFQIGDAVKQLWEAIGRADLEHAAAANTALVERLDADLTRLWRMRHKVQS